MTVKEYLQQSYRLDQKIKSDVEEIQMLRLMMTGVSSPSFDEHLQTMRQTEALFVLCMAKVADLEEELNDEINTFISLRRQIHSVINSVPDADERMVLCYRYVHNKKWEEISNELHESISTVKRQHSSALEHVSMPKDAIEIES
jgi:DNA-directed RNA polymerase specialized sigma subunit, sigma24 homolog